MCAPLSPTELTEDARARLAEATTLRDGADPMGVYLAGT